MTAGDVVALLLVVGILVAVFAGFNIGDSSPGVAFGPAVGSRTVSKLGAAGLMTAFALAGGWTVGRNVIALVTLNVTAGQRFHRLHQ